MVDRFYRKTVVRRTQGQVGLAREGRRETALRLRVSGRMI